MQLVFADLDAHALCADVARATAYWGAGWAAVSLCLSLLLDSLDISDLRRWAALDVRIGGGLIRVTHRDAVITLAPLTDDETVLVGGKEDAVNHLDHIRKAKVIEVTCSGVNAAARRTC